MKRITEWMRTHKLYAAAVVIMALVSATAAAASGIFSPVDTESGKVGSGQTETNASDTTDIPLHITADKS